MKRLLPYCAILTLLVPAPAFPRPVDRAVAARPEMVDMTGEAASPGRLVGLSYFGLVDTVTYGGTCWAADSLRWEAFRDSIWTFEGGQGSYLNDGTNPNKPVGWHQVFDGWYGIDQTLTPLPWFRRSTTCVIDGSWSFWCGITTAESQAECWSGGGGYGNGWALYIVKKFSYPGAGSITLTFDYAVESEPGYDYMYVLMDTTGLYDVYDDGDLLLAYYTGTDAGTESFTISSSDLPSPGHDIHLKFYCASDGGYSDEDGLYPTTCGHTAVDNIALSGAVTDLATFETGADGWYQVLPTQGIGDFTHLAWIPDLPAPKTFCPCGVTDSVLVFFNQEYETEIDLDNIAVSPWMDFKRGGDVGRPGKLILYQIYAELPLANYAFGQFRVRYYPEICLNTGKLYQTGWKDQNIIFYWGEQPACTPRGAFQSRDYTAIVNPAAEKMQLAVGTLSLCTWAGYGVPCSGASNTTPWFDQIGVGVYGSAGAPLVAILTFDILQDNFATDGTLNPASSGRLDTNKLKNGSTPGPGVILCDTLVVGGDGGNTEVDIVFRVHPGPFTNLTGLTNWAARWTPHTTETPCPTGVYYGDTWYIARLDTAEQGGLPTQARWMGCFHESDPGFSGSDTDADAADPSQNANEIFPDHILTPGSRIDYFFKASYLPPDPRNPTGDACYLLPDTGLVQPAVAGRRFFEVEILPSSVTHDSTWNCTLYVDHHHDRSLVDQTVEEAGLTQTLGTGSNNVEHSNYDRFDNQTPSSGQLSLGRGIQQHYGASIIQMLAYMQVSWHTGNLASGSELTDEDANILAPWLRLRVNTNRLYGSGDGLVYGMYYQGHASTTHFYQNTLGVLYRCGTIRNAACPSGTAIDSTYCIPLTDVPGGYFAHTTATSGRGNGCPDVAGFDLINTNASVTTARGDYYYLKNAANTNYASVANWVTLDVYSDYKTVIDAVPVGRMRTTPTDPHNAGLCTDQTAGRTRHVDVLTWFGISMGSCTFLPDFLDVPEGDLQKPPQFRHALGNAYPNPMNPATRIQFTNGVEGGRVTLQVFDVTGRLVRTLVNGALAAGPHEVTWDGTTDSGLPAPGGMYFYRMTAGDYTASNKLVVLN